MGTTDRDVVHARPLVDAPFGVAVDFEPRTAMDAACAGELRTLLARHHLLVLHGAWSDADQIELVACFGRVLPQGPRVLVNDHPEGDHPIVTFVSNRLDGGLGTFELMFHHDLAHVPTPLGGLSLYALEVGEGQAPTRFANGRLAYERLGATERERLARLQSLFAANYTTTTDAALPARAVRDALDPTWPRTVHPVVVPHPVTGDNCIFVNEMMTAEILGLDRRDGDAILDELFALLYDPANIYEHHWKVGDLVVWDNLVVQHARPAVLDATPRTLRRVVFGEKAPWEQWPYPAAHR